MTYRISCSYFTWTTDKFFVIVGIALDGMNTILSSYSWSIMMINFTDCYSRLYYPTARD